MKVRNHVLNPKKKTPNSRIREMKTTPIGREVLKRTKEALELLRKI